MTWKTLAAVALGIGLIGTAGCDGKKDPGKPADGKKKDEEHTHGAGPHKGVVFDIAGGKYHGEFVVDHPKKEVTVYILGSDEKTPAPVEADKVVLTITNAARESQDDPKAAPEPRFQVDLLPKDRGADGKASAFSGTHKRFGHEQEFSGTVTFEAKGKPFAGDFEEKPEKK